MSKKTIRLLHLYYDLMNLYGDWANAAVLERELLSRGFNVVYDKKSAGDDIKLSSYDFIYIGSGTERSQRACMADLEKYKVALIVSIQTGVPVLATGNSHELFGKAVTDAAGDRYDTIGLLDFETSQTNKRVTGDCIFTAKAPFSSGKMIGFINRAGGSQQGDVERPFSVRPCKGAGFKAFHEGIMYKNLLGTYMTGPVLVRNPLLLDYFASVLMGGSIGDADTAVSGDAMRDLFFDFQNKAYKASLKSMK